MKSLRTFSDKAPQLALSQAGYWSAGADSIEGFYIKQPVLVEGCDRNFQAIILLMS